MLFMCDSFVVVFYTVFVLEQLTFFHGRLYRVAEGARPSAAEHRRSASVFVSVPCDFN